MGKPLICFALLLITAPLPAAEIGANGKYLLTRDNIRSLNVRTINDLMNQVPGVSAGTSSISILGSSAVRVFLDGRPINDPLSSRGTVKWELVSLNEIERIEVISGGETALYGDDSSGGVIRITTRRMDGDRGSIDLGIGRFHAGNIDLDYQTRLRNLGVGISLGGDWTDGFRVNNDINSRTAGFKLNVPRNESAKLDLSLDHAREERGSPGLPEFPTPNARARNSTSGATLSHTTDHYLGTAYINHFERHNTNPDTALDTTLQSRAIGADLKGELALPTLGRTKVGSNLEIAEVSGNRVQSQREERLGLVGAKTVESGEGATRLTFSLRWNYYSEYEETTSPELKLEHKVGRFNLTAGAAWTNNIPTFLQRYSESTTTRQNPDLQMEDITSYRLGAALQANNALTAGVSLFDSRISDNITFIRGGDGIGSYQNVGRVTQRGAEISLKWKPLSDWEIKPTHLYLHTFDEDTGNTLPFKPRRQSRLDIQWRISPDWTAGANTQLISQQYSRADHQAPVHGYAVTNFQTDYTWGQNRLLLRIDNIFDRDYKYSDGFPAPPCIWYASWNREF